MTSTINPTEILVDFEMDSFIKGYHAYRFDWNPKVNEVLKAIPEPTNPVDKYAVCVLVDEEVTGHLKRGKDGRFAKTIFYFLRADPHSSCIATVKGKAVNLGDGEGMQVPCKLTLRGERRFVDILKEELGKQDP